MGTNKAKRKPIGNKNNKKNVVSNGATIFDLGKEDKDKIGNLIRKVVELDTQCKSTKEKASQTKLKQQVNCLKSQNNQIIKEHSKLRSRFRDSLKLLQNYQVKLDQMETSKSTEQKSISSDHKTEKQTEQIQKEITDLKQLILDLHAKEQKVKTAQKPTPRQPQQTYFHHQ